MMNMVKSTLDFIFDSRLEDLDTIIDERGVYELEEKVLEIEDFLEKEAIINQIIVEVMDIAYKTGFEDSSKLFIEMTDIKWE